jgi:hypothetical protein
VRGAIALRRAHRDVAEPPDQRRLDPERHRRAG